MCSHLSAWCLHDVASLLMSLLLSSSISLTHICFSFALYRIPILACPNPFCFTVFIPLRLCPHFGLYFYLFLRRSLAFLLPLAAPSEGRLWGVILPPRQLHITSCLRKLHSLSPSSSLPCLPFLSRCWLIWIQRVGAARCSPSLLSDCDTNYLYLIINGAI